MSTSILRFVYLFKLSKGKMDYDRSDFGLWLTEKIKDRQMSQAELARQAGVTRAGINGIIIGGRRPGVRLCKSIAMVLRIPIDEVFQAAGLLPIKDNTSFDQINHLLSLLPSEEVQDVVDYINMKIDQNERKTKYRIHPKLND